MDDVFGTSSVMPSRTLITRSWMCMHNGCFGQLVRGPTSPPPATRPRHGTRHMQHRRPEYLHTCIPRSRSTAGLAEPSSASVVQSSIPTVSPYPPWPPSDARNTVAPLFQCHCWSSRHEPSDPDPVAACGPATCRASGRWAPPRPLIIVISRAPRLEVGSARGQSAGSGPCHHLRPSSLFPLFGKFVPEI
jgi:hypothetical protein